MNLIPSINMLYYGIQSEIMSLTLIVINLTIWDADKLLNFKQYQIKIKYFSTLLVTKPTVRAPSDQAQHG